ncbi:MAG: DUF58 domain-containing protein [Bacteroidota bacterium]
MKFIRNIYISWRFYALMAGVISIFALSYPFPYLFPVAQVALAFIVALLLVDILVLHVPGATIKARRKLPPTISLGDEFEVKIKADSRLRLPVTVSLTDEAPYQLQLRHLKLVFEIGPDESKTVSYTIRPLQRGKYEFGDIQLFITSPLGIAIRRFTQPAEQMVAVYPSVLQMKKYELKVFARLNLTQGIKRVRRLGHSTEFEQIKNYVQGDDYRSINWKATSRKAELMINQYEDEKAQQVYCIIDKSRSMRMPFEGMTLLDHAINSALVMSNIALRKGDRAGLITFGNKIGSKLTAERNPSQLKRILEILYKQKTHFLEANYELLYFGVRNVIKGRSLILLYSNFESMYSLQRALPLLRKINAQHLLVVIFFENTELKDASKMTAGTIKEIYFKTIAEKFTHEKQLIAQELKKHAIQTILTTPQNLSVDTINKYLELKSRGMI